MRLVSARVQNYRSIRDTGIFSVEGIKTILVGPNEAGKTAILQALQKLNPPPEIKKFSPLRDYPRAAYNDMATGKVKASETDVVTGWFSLDAKEMTLLPPQLRVEGNKFCYVRRLDESVTYCLETAPQSRTYGNIKSDALRLAAHLSSLF